jgi:hypothetical protein
MAAGQSLADGCHPRAPAPRPRLLQGASNRHNSIKFSGVGPAFHLILARCMAGHQNTPAEGGVIPSYIRSIFFLSGRSNRRHSDDLAIIVAC